MNRRATRMLSHLQTIQTINNARQRPVAAVEGHVW